MPRDLIGVRYTMWATVVPRLETPGPQAVPVSPTDKGSYVVEQDPDSGQMITVWKPEATPTASTPAARYDIPCYARGYTNLGFRSSANRESYLKGVYDEMESIQFDYPNKYILSHQSYVTNIRSHKDDTDYIWIDAATSQAIVWEVQGITPVTDPFGAPLRYTTVLKRARIQ